MRGEDAQTGVEYVRGERFINFVLLNVGCCSANEKRSIKTAFEDGFI